MLRLLAPLAGLIALLAGAADARSSTDAEGGCKPFTAQITSDPSVVLDYSSAQPEGAPLEGDTIRRPGHFYELQGAVELRLNGNIVWASKGSILKLTCYRRTRTGRDYPAVGLLRGSLKLKTSASDPAGVLTEEGLFDPRLAPTLLFTVKRTLTRRGDVTMEQKLTWFANFGDQPMGTTVVSSRGIVGVTPFVGSQPGSCRYIHGARLTTTSGYGRGTATYRP